MSFHPELCLGGASAVSAPSRTSWWTLGYLRVFAAAGSARVSFPAHISRCTCGSPGAQGTGNAHCQPCQRLPQHCPVATVCLLSVSLGACEPLGSRGLAMPCTLGWVTLLSGVGMGRARGGGLCFAVWRSQRFPDASVA